MERHLHTLCFYSVFKNRLRNTQSGSFSTPVWFNGYDLMTPWPWACTYIHGKCRSRFIGNKKRDTSNDRWFAESVCTIVKYTPYQPLAVEGPIGLGETSHNNSLTNKSSRGLFSWLFANQTLILAGWVSRGAEGTHQSSVSVPLAAVSSWLNWFSITAAHAAVHAWQVQICKFNRILTCGYHAWCVHQDIMS